MFLKKNLFAACAAVAIAAIIVAPASSLEDQVTGNVNIVGSCGMSVISGSPIDYGSLASGSTSGEQTLVLDNTGSVNALLEVHGTNWLDAASVNKMDVGNTKFSTATGTYSSKAAVSSTDQTVTATMSEATNLNTYWQLQANLLDASFTGPLTQTLDFTTTCCPLHSNGLGGTYLDCDDPLGTPGDASTYNQFMAGQAAASAPFVGSTSLTTCGTGAQAGQAVRVIGSSSAAVWVFTGPLAGYVHLNAANNTPECPSGSDPTWT